MCLKLEGAMNKRIYYFASSMCRIVSFIALIIAFIVVKITVSPAIEWLNALLITLAILALVTGIINLMFCGLTATSYSQKGGLQIACFIITLLTGGIFASTFSGIATFVKPTKEEIESENIFKVKKY